MTQLTPTLYAVEVPDEAKNFTVIQSHSYFHSPRIEHSVGGVDILIKDSVLQWKILGTVTPDAIDFDCDFIGTKDAFLALMYSKGCDLTKKYVIIKSKI